MEIRWLIARDMPEVAEVERACFVRDSLNDAAVRSVMKRRNVIGNVAIDPGTGTLTGYSLYALLPQAIEILRLAVHPHDQRCGCGSEMVQRIVDKLDQQGHDRTAVICRVPETCLAMLLLLQANGFVATDFVGGVVLMTFSDDLELRRWRSPAAVGLVGG